MDLPVELRQLRYFAAVAEELHFGRAAERLHMSLEKEAADLKRRFNRDFWVSDGEYFAPALDTEGNQVDALALNNGHLLWSGIVDKVQGRRSRGTTDGTPSVLGVRKRCRGRVGRVRGITGDLAQ